MTDKIKIFISYHDEHYLLKSRILQPIQTGCAMAEWIFSGMLRDDLGDNISAENGRYCELTAQYWVWKNYDKVGSPDYVGFMHYRRHFMFDGWNGNPDWCWLPKSNMYFVPYITPQYLQHISDDNIRTQLVDCDCLVLKPYDVKHVNSGSIGEQYCKLPEQERATFDIFIKTVKRLYPEYMTGIEKIERGSVQYLCNMFVMKKELFFEYSEFCFAVLKEVDRQIDHNGMSTQGLRFLGYLGEFLLSIFIFNLKAKGGYRIKELNGSYILSDNPVFHPRLSYWGYWVLSKLTFGAVKKRYKQKRKELKQIRHIQNK